MIDQVVNKYNNNYETFVKKIEVTKPNIANNDKKISSNNGSSAQSKSIVNEKKSTDNVEPQMETISDKASVLPRSFLRSLDIIKQEIDPQILKREEEVVNKFRKSRYKTAISIKFLRY